jgi:hypothetical protein
MTDREHLNVPCLSFLEIDMNMMESNAGGTWCGRISFCYGRSTPPSSHPWSSASSGDSPRTSSSSKSSANSPSSSRLSSASLSPIATPIPTAWSTTTISLPFGSCFFIYLFFFPTCNCCNHAKLHNLSCFVICLTLGT